MKGAACCAGAVASGSAAIAFAQPPPALDVTSVRGRLLRVQGSGCNILLQPTRDGLVMVDSGSSAERPALQRVLAERFPEQPVTRLFSTHWHLEHTGANDTFGAAGATIIGHENTRLWMSTRIYVDWQDKTYSPRPAVAWPSETFRTSDPQPRKLETGGDTFYYGHLPGAHTDGDIYVYLPAENVIAAGGAVTPYRWPVMDYVTGGWIGGLVDSMDLLLEFADAQTVIVPDAGPVQSRSDLADQRDMLATVRERMEAMALEGMSAGEMLESGVTRDFDARWHGDRRRFITNVYHGLWWGNRLRGIIA